MNLWPRSTSSGALNRRCEGDVDTPDVAVDGYGVRLEWIFGRPAQHGSRPHIELRAVQRARHCGAIERALTQWRLLVRTTGLRRTETSFDAEHRHITQQQHRPRRHFADAECVLPKRCAHAPCGGCDCGSMS